MKKTVNEGHKVDLIVIIVMKIKALFTNISFLNIK
jgi:hypothetical protein